MGIDSKEQSPIKRRLAVIDGCNVMYSCAGISGLIYPELKPVSQRRPDALGLLIVTKWLLMENFDLKIVIPSSYMSDYSVANFFILQALQKLGYVIVDKSKKVLDDLAILGLATINRGFVISSDRYKDHRNHKDLVNTIENHLVSFSMRRVTMDEIGGKDIMCLDTIKNITGVELNLQLCDAMFSQKGRNSDYSYVRGVRESWSQTKQVLALQAISIILDYLQQEFCILHRMPPPVLPYFNPKQKYLPPTFSKFLEIHAKFYSLMP